MTPAELKGDTQMTPISKLIKKGSWKASCPNVQQETGYAAEMLAAIERGEHIEAEDIKAQFEALAMARHSWWVEQSDESIVIAAECALEGREEDARKICAEIGVLAE